MTMLYWAPFIVKTGPFSGLGPGGPPDAAKDLSQRPWGEATVYERCTRTPTGSGCQVREGDRHGLYYTYEVTHYHGVFEVVDPYAKALGVNGDRGMVVDLARTNPEGWDDFPKPQLKNFTDAIIYEVHIRDFSIHENSGIRHRGKYLGVVEPETRGPQK